MYCIVKYIYIYIYIYTHTHTHTQIKWNSEQVENTVTNQEKKCLSNLVETTVAERAQHAATSGNTCK